MYRNDMLSIIKENMKQLTIEQVEKLNSVFPQGIEDLSDEDLLIALNLINRTIYKNKQEVSK